MSLRNARLLEWYLRDGVRIADRSPAGAQYARAELYGTPVQQLREEAPRRRKKDKDSCAMCGSDLADETCDACGYSEAIRAYRITQGSGETPTYNHEPPDGDDMVRRSAAIKRLVAVRRADPLAAEALEAFYGDLGSLYRASTPHHELFAVIPLTPKGRDLDAAALKDAQNPGMASHQRINWLIAQDRGKHAVAISIAVGQAAKLYARAVALWNEASGREEGGGDVET